VERRVDANILRMTQRHNLKTASEAMEESEWKLADKVNRNRGALTDFDILFDMTDILSANIFTEEFVENE
jgi:hypothetical protein